MKYYSALLFSLLVAVAAFAKEKPHFHHPMAFMESIKADPKKGEKIYNSMCANCHAIQPMLNVGAPRFRNTLDWQERQKKGLEKLVLSLQDNLGIMPARGGCFECTDKDLAAAIAHMLPAPKKTKAA